MEFEQIDIEFAKLTQNFRYTQQDLLHEAKRYFEKTLHSIGKYELELVLIVDANIIFQEGLSLAKKGKSSLISISKSPFCRLLGPTWLLKELDKKIPIVAKENGVNERDLREAINEIIKNINIVEVRNENVYRLAASILGGRDPEGKDVPYVALYLTVKSNGILTADEDIAAQSTIKTWNKVGFAGKIVSSFERGSISFLILGKGLPIVLAALYEVTIAVLCGLWNVVKVIGNAVLSITASGVAALSALPDWVILAIGIVAVVVAFRKEAQEWLIKNIFGPILKTIVDMLKGIYEIIKNVLLMLERIVEISVEAVGYLLENVGAALMYYESINLSGNSTA